MRVLFYYRGSEHIGVQSIMAYLKSKGHLVELIYEPALGDNGYIDIPFLNKFFYNEKLSEYYHMYPYEFFVSNYHKYK